MRKLLLVGAVLVAGCGSGAQEFVVNGLKLDASDQLYTSKPMGYFCDMAPLGQIKIQFFDYAPACVLDQKPADPDPRDPALEHTELDIVLGGLGTSHQDLRTPFSVSKVDCVIGPGDNGTAYFYHYPAGAMMPDVTTQVDSGSVKIDAWDKTNATAVKGNFSLVFGGSKVSGTLNTFNCDH